MSVKSESHNCFVLLTLWEMSLDLWIRAKTTNMFIYFMTKSLRPVSALQFVTVSFMHIKKTASVNLMTLIQALFVNITEVRGVCRVRRWGLLRHMYSLQLCHNSFGAIFLQALPRLRHLPQWWLARLKGYYQENSFAYITGLSANQSALSKHSNPNRDPGLRDWWVTHSAAAPATHEPPFQPSHHTLG